MGVTGSGVWTGTLCWARFSTALQQWLSVQPLGTISWTIPEPPPETVEVHPEPHIVPWLPNPNYTPGVDPLRRPAEFPDPAPQVSETDEDDDSPETKKSPYWWPDTEPSDYPDPGNYPNPGGDPWPEPDPNDSPNPEPPANTDYPDPETEPPSNADDASELWGMWSRKWPFSLPWDMWAIINVFNINGDPPEWDVVLFDDQEYAGLDMEIEGTLDMVYFAPFRPFWQALIVIGFLFGLIFVVVKIYGGAK
jgi:hypothetical protein